jgi:soluble lytic murein transglycosylase-like protein
MKKRQKKTLPRTLKWARAWVKPVLIAMLFLPGILLVEGLAGPDPATEMAQVAQTPRPRELVKVYSIVKSNRPDIRDAEAWKISETIFGESSGYGLDPMLVLALIDVESKFQYASISPSGARGIMQILPDVGKALAEESGLEPGASSHKFRPERLDDPVFNIKLGVYYLHDLKKSFRSLNLALIAYNLGPTEIRNRLENNLEYSEDYATTVLTAFRKYKTAKPPLL